MDTQQQEGCEGLSGVGASGDGLRLVPCSLFLAQMGGKHVSAKPLKGIGAGLLELVEDFDGDTYRAVYSVRFGNLIYVLHAFQKKSKKGIATPKKELDLIKRRLKDAEDDYEWRKKKG